MQYKAIDPRVPGISSTFLSYSAVPSQGLPSSLGIDVVVNTAGLSEDESRVLYYESKVYQRLADRPVLYRHNGSTVDMEIYIDSYSYIQETPSSGSVDEFPNISKVEAGYYTRSSSVFVYAGIKVPPKSSLVWDGRHSVAVDKNMKIISAASRMNQVYKEVRSALENKDLQPTTVVGLQGLATTRYEPAANLNRSKYEDELKRFLELNYNSVSIPSKTKDILSNKSKSSSVLQKTAANSRYKELLDKADELNAERSTVQIAAMLDGNYFVKWVEVAQKGAVIKNSTKSDSSSVIIK